MRRRARQFYLVQTEQRLVLRRHALDRRGVIGRRSDAERRHQSVEVPEDRRQKGERRESVDRRLYSERRDSADRRKRVSSLLRDGLAVRDLS